MHDWKPEKIMHLGEKSAVVSGNEIIRDIPEYYAQGRIQPWDAIDDWKLEYYTASAVAYICRHRHKEDPILDIQKAIDHLIHYKKLLVKEFEAVK